MAKDKKSFVLYCDLIHTVRKLPKEDAGELFLHILEYVNDLNPETENALVDVTFEHIKQHLKRDLQKYESMCARNSENGKKGGRPKKPKQSEETQSVFKEPKKADNDSDNDSDTKKNIPLWEDFQKYALSKQQNLDPSHLRLKYEAWLENDWCITRNNKQQPIKNWKSTLLQTIPYLNTVAPKDELRELTKGEAVAALNVPAMLDKLLQDGYTKEQINNYAK